MSNAFVVRVPVGLPDPQTGADALYQRGAILAHPAHLLHLRMSAHHAAHGHFVTLPDDHPAVAAHRVAPLSLSAPVIEPPAL